MNEKTRILLQITLFALGPVFCAHGQGRIAFNNYASLPSPVTINPAPGTFNPADGPAGAWVGSDYSASLLFVPGIVTNQATFDGLNPVWLADGVFWGTTGTGPGHGLGGDGAGFFDGPTVIVPGVSGGFATFQALAWYNGGGLYGSYAEALAAGHNVGQSKLVSVVVTLPPAAVANLDGLQPFTVGIPEPSTILPAVLGGAALLLFGRRRK